jgi:hypothetical protein
VAAEVTETDVKRRRYRARTTSTRRVSALVRADVADALAQEADTSRRSQAAIVEEALVKRYGLVPA